MESIGSLFGLLLGWLVFYLFFDLVVRMPGYFIYCALFTKREYDPDNQQDVDMSSAKVVITGVVFWMLVLGSMYGLWILGK